MRCNDVCFPPTIVWRHRKENLKKCTLSGLENRKDFLFFVYPKDQLPCLKNYLLLDLKGPVLSRKDRGKGFFLIDATWRYAQVMARRVPLVERRTLPHGFKTSYPRKKTGCIDSERGLASIEALYIASLCLGRNFETLLKDYYWRDSFLETNISQIESAQTVCFS